MKNVALPSMKTIIFLSTVTGILLGESSYAACGPDWCCSRPRLCGRGPEISQWNSDEVSCLYQAADGVYGRTLTNPTGYPFSIINRSSLQEAAKVSWSDGVCVVKYSPGYFQSQRP